MSKWTVYVTKVRKKWVLEIYPKLMSKYYIFFLISSTNQNVEIIFLVLGALKKGCTRKLQLYVLQNSRKKGEWLISVGLKNFTFLPDLFDLTTFCLLYIKKLRNFRSETQKLSLSEEYVQCIFYFYHAKFIEVNNNKS